MKKFFAILTILILSMLIGGIVGGILAAIFDIELTPGLNIYRSAHSIIDLLTGLIIGYILFYRKEAKTLS